MPQDSDEAPVKVLGPLYPMTQKTDSVGAAVQAQATHDAQVQELRSLLDSYYHSTLEQTEDLASLERMYARAIARVGELEGTLDAIRAECQGLLEEKRALRSTARGVILEHVRVHGYVLGDEVAGELVKKADAL
jgi:hypothetical protein